MTIDCETFEDFMNSIAGLVERGIKFESNATTYKITLTGSF